MSSYAHTFIHGVLCNNKRAQIPCNSMAASQEHYAEQKKRNTKVQILYVFIYMNEVLK